MVRMRVRGFTLIEILIVLAIVALLLTLSAPRYFGTLEQSKDAVLQENLSATRRVIDTFRTDKGRYPESLEELVQEKYLRSVPLDPITQSSNSWILLSHPNSSERGIFDLKSGAAGQARDGRKYAEF